MACFCGVCAIRLHDATENGGSFQTTSGWLGWDKGKINDTCESCAEALRSAVSLTASGIAAKHSERVALLSKQMEIWEKKARERKEFEKEFRREFEKAKRERGYEP